MPIHLVTDSVADLPAEFITKYGIKVVPSLIVVGPQIYRDGVDLTREEFYRRLPGLDPVPTTAAPAAGEYAQVYRALPAGPILSLQIAASLSGIYNSARLGAQEFGDRVRVIDTGSLSLGAGWQVIAAAEAAAAGKSLDEVLAAIADTRRRLRVYALLDTLDYLRRGGRLSLIRASIAGLLQIKPLIELADGALTVLASNRTHKKALADFVSRVQALGTLERAAVLYTDNDSIAGQVCDLIAGQCRSGPLVAQAAPTIGAHVGPDAVAVAVVQSMPDPKRVE
jgi:DegV family protein with EDD domain